MATVLDPAARRRVLIAICIGTFMATLDGTIVNVALPTIANEFQADVGQLQWIVSSYLLTITGLLPLWGKLADVWGRGKIYTYGFIAFIFGSAICSLGWSVASLSLFRVVQAIGAAMLTGTGMALVSQVYPENERGKAMGIVGTAVSLGLISGPAVGGFLVALLDWRSIFYVNVPVGLFGFWLGQRTLARLAEETHGDLKQFDYAGALLSIAAVGLFVYSLDSIISLGFTHPLVIGGLVGAVLAGVAFISVERRAKDPLVSLALFKNGGASFGMLATLFTFIALFFFNFIGPQVAAAGLGLQSEEMGLALTALPLGMLVVGPPAGWLSDRVGARLPSVIGLLVAALGLYLLSEVQAGMGALDLAWRALILGLGSGAFQPPNNSAVLGSVPPAQRGIVGSLLSMVRTLGQLMGVALSALLFTAILARPLSGAPLPSIFSSFSVTLKVAALVMLVALVPAWLSARPRKTEEAPD